jgi:hypothetical protein
MARDFQVAGPTLVKVKGGATMVKYKSLEFMGYKGYRVGDDGSVWSKRRGGGWGEWRKLKPSGGPNRSCSGYGLYDSSSKLKTHKAHRLVLTAFVGPCPIGMEGCHWDGDTSNNHLDNLRWDYHENNEKDKLRHGTRVRGSKIGNAKLNEAQVATIKRLAKSGRTNTSLALDFNVSNVMIGYIVSGKFWRHVNG